MTRPSLQTCIDALRWTDPRFPWVQPTDDEADAADALEVVQDHHQGDADRPDRDARWGVCAACAEPWPCPVWGWGEQLAVQWLGRAAVRVYHHATGRNAA